jgi:hypothetical protein
MAYTTSANALMLHIVSWLLTKRIASFTDTSDPGLLYLRCVTNKAICFLLAIVFIVLF